MKTVYKLALIALFLGLPGTGLAADLKKVDLGQCQLDSGQTLKPCEIGFRTVGALNQNKDNAILVPTWFSGNSDHALQFAVTYIDTNVFYIIAVDALGNGVSTSPSNSPTQGGSAFPDISIGDMVATQYRLVTDVLGLDQLYAVSGASMGGMQTFEWMVAYPGFVGKAVPLIGSPKLGAYDVALWTSQLTMLDYFDDCQCEQAARIMASTGQLFRSSPKRVDAQGDASQVAADLSTRAAAILQRPSGWSFDTRSQVLAMLGHDISRNFDQDMAEASKMATAELFSVVVDTDHVVTPWAATRFARLDGGESMMIDSDGGHGAIFVPGTGFEDRVRDFLAIDTSNEGIQVD